MRIITTGGEGHPQQGQVISDVTIPDPPKAPDVSAFKGIIRAKAKRLSKAGQHLESISLLKTIGE